MDSTTVVFLRDVKGINGEAEYDEVKDLLRSYGVRVEYCDGALEQGWQMEEYDMDVDFSNFADWVDGEVARRSAVAKLSK